MTELSENKKKILQEAIQNSNKPIPQQVKRIIQKTKFQTILLDEKFKNLQDPLNFIRTKRVQLLMDEAQKTSDSLHRQMEQISDFSKLTYKKIISRESTQFNFQRLQESIWKDQPIINQTEIDFNNYRIKKEKQRKAKLLNQQLTLSGKPITDPSLLESFKPKQKTAPKEYLHKIQTFQQIREIGKTDLNFQHIKLIDTPQFDKNCKQVQFYDMLKSQKSQNHRLYNQPFDIDNNKPIQKAINLLQYNLIESSAEFSTQSKTIFYNFQENLKFWKQKNSNGGKISNQAEQKQKKSDEQILSLCSQFNKKHLQVNNLCDFAMRKITADMLNPFYKIKQDHQLKLQTDKKNENLDEMYQQLKKQFQFAKQMRLKSKTQRIPSKPVDCESQTIQIMQQKQFDDYFCQDTNVIFEKLSKLNALRQKAMMKKKQTRKLVIIKNICLDINEMLFKLLIMMIKGQKFYPKNQMNSSKSVPYFSYSDLLSVDNRQQVQKKILQLIYTRLSQFQVEYIDGVSKSKIISIYVQERQKNNKILQILHN